PIEKSLQHVRPRYSDTPACHARCSKPTYCVDAPSREINTCAETSSAAIVSKNGCACGSSRFTNRASIHGPPKRPGGRLIPCTTIRSSETPGGRASQFGEGTFLTPRIQPLSMIIG